MRWSLIASSLLAILFVILSFTAGNSEFVFYGLVVAAIVAALHSTDHLFCYRRVALWGFFVWGVLHLLGGLVQVGAGNLYALVLIELVGSPYDILKYDQVVHVLCYIVVALIFSSIVETIASADANHWLLGLITVLAACGVGALNEIVELIAFVVLAETGVGGYVNTALDLVANLIGAIIGAFWFHQAHR